MKSTLVPALLLSVTWIGAGCISTHKTVCHDPERLKVEFENDAAGRIFYEALSKTEKRLTHSESRTEVSIPLLFEHEQRTVEGQNAAFNEAVRRCDTNGDGKITELEAKIFSEQAAKPK